MKPKLPHLDIIQLTERLWSDECENVFISLHVFSCQNPPIDPFIFLLSACGWNRKAIVVEVASNRVCLTEAARECSIACAKDGNDTRKGKEQLPQLP
jgi:hypothetical protein